MAQIASPVAAASPLAVQDLLQTSLELRDRYARGEISEHGLRSATGRAETKLDRMLAFRYQNPANRRLARHLIHEQPWIFSFLHGPGLDATNNGAERAIRGMVIARKVWGGNRTWEGAHTQEILVSVLRTCRQQGKDAFGRVVSLLRTPQTAILDIVPGADCTAPPPSISMLESLTFCGRTFAADELELMRQTAAEFSTLGVTEIARTICELVGWQRPGGGLKNHECRQLLERLAAEGALQLPELRKLGGRGPRRADVSGPRVAPASIECAASACEPLELALVEGKVESRLWRELMERHHYLAWRVPFGANLR